MAAAVPLIRLVVLSTVILFALIALAMAATLTSTTSSSLHKTFPFEALGIVAAGLTMVTVPPMIALEMLRPGGPTSMIIVELLWLGFLSIMWLVTGADTAAFTFSIDTVEFGKLSISCGSTAANYIETLDKELGVPSKDTPNVLCSERMSLEAFAFLNWIILMGYIGMVLVMALIAVSRKHTNVWTSSVANAPFFEPARDSESSVPTSYKVDLDSKPGGFNVSASVQSGAVHV
ncbi:hypothetical protein C8R45DRAFT_1212761 [Mycena sanguinolenta]|nr:hypothetical protein C8R45DRAFT_1212761 [Mycena sanguinolenta]